MLSPFLSSRHSFAFLTLCCVSLATACGSAAGEYEDDEDNVVPIVENGELTPAGRGQLRKATPSVSNISPRENPAAGGTTLTVYGSNFVSGGGLAVAVGGTPCTSVVFVSSSTLRCTTPAKTAGYYSVVVTNPNYNNSGSSGNGLYQAVAPVITPPPPPPPTGTSGIIRGTNLVGMEGGYSFNQSTGPVPNTQYAVHSNAIVDYLATKNVNVIRLLFSWERMQSTLGGPIPAATTGYYKQYFDDYKRIVDYATNTKGMSVIVEPWQASTSGGVGGPSWRGNVVGSGVVTNAHFSDFWSKMATIFASNPRVIIGLVNEPNNMSTMTWFSAAQSAITAIRATGFAGDLHIPGNGWTGAGTWNDSWYDTAATKRSNAYGWLNARGTGQPLLDPLNKLIVAVHTYANSDASGSATDVISSTISRQRVKVTVDWARANGLKAFVGEIGMYAGAANAAANWADFTSYATTNSDTLIGWAWWACGKPGWWDDVAANNGGHFSITPTNSYTTDTVNMNMIESSF